MGMELCRKVRSISANFTDNLMLLKSEQSRPMKILLSSALAMLLAMAIIRDAFVCRRDAIPRHASVSSRHRLNGNQDRWLYLLVRRWPCSKVTQQRKVRSYVRFQFPEGYHIPPHTHRKTERVTVISVALYLATGESLDRSNAIKLSAGSFGYWPAGNETCSLV